LFVLACGLRVKQYDQNTRKSYYLKIHIYEQLANNKMKDESFKKRGEREISSPPTKKLVK